MRLITRCPFCSTLFKVAPDQLLISEGWVRCGQCREAFDASLQLLPQQAAEAAPDSADDLPDQRKPALWKKPAAQIGLSLCVLAFVLGLLVQITFQERDRISAFKPGLKPWLTSLCASLGCKISPLRLVDSISIDSSALTRLRGDTYRINLVVKNTGVVELAMPAIELTLTNSLDQPLVRRVLRPEEFASQLTLGAAVELPAAFTFSIKTTEASERMTGYRLIAFYP